MATKLFSRIRLNESALLICDMQEKFRNNIKFFPQILAVTQRLMKAANILEMKIVASEQYTKGLGFSVPELELSENKIKIFEKTRFSMCLPKLRQELGQNVKTIILCGIEAHVCIYHTVLDFLQQDYNVFVVADGCSSRTNIDRFFAFRHLEKAGAVITTSECVIFGLVEDSKHPKFQEIRKLILEPAPDSGLENF